ncbi:MAG TPA: MBL fold metallo-hydrolase [Verrucomicrobiae bacterium]|nr:MBL fold metallo-hydrolase [Verrucomicrobiae bacterium]
MHAGRRRLHRPLSVAAAAALAPVLLVALTAIVSPSPAWAHAGGHALAEDPPASDQDKETPAAPPEPPPPPFKLEKVSEHGWCLFGVGGNVGILANDAGVLVVDDQYENVAPGIVEQIRSISDKPIRWLVNTHYHGDHTGGNAVFKPLTEIVAHDTVRSRLLDYPRVVVDTFPARMQAIHVEVMTLADEKDPYRDALMHDLDLMKFLYDLSKAFDPLKAAPPGITYKDGLTLWLGDQPVEIAHYAPGHTDGDSVVYFPKEKVVHMGDLLFNGLVPFIDMPGGGSARGYLTNLNKVLDRLPADTKVIPGHGPVTDVAGLRHARDFMRDMQSEVTKAIQRGLTRQQAARSIKLATYTDIKPAFRTVANDVLAFYDEMRSKKK